MATEWKSQQCFGEGKYYLQFETDDKDKFKFMEKSAQSAIDGKLDIKTEVAREIFAEIEKLIYRYLNDFDYSGGDMIYDLNELKNKYTKEGVNK